MGDDKIRTEKRIDPRQVRCELCPAYDLPENMYILTETGPGILRAHAECIEFVRSSPMRQLLEIAGATIPEEQVLH